VHNEIRIDLLIGRLPFLAENGRRILYRKSDLTNTLICRIIQAYVAEISSAR
jgi:hypothetical protein